MNFFQKIKYEFQRREVLTQVIVINVAVFLTVNIIGNVSHLDLVKYLGLPIGASDFLFKFWTLFTYMFTHEGLGHLFWNMVTFYFLSKIFFTFFAEKKLLYLYVMSGIAGGVIVLILGIIFPASFANSVLIGASASVLGIGAVTAVYSPNYKVYPFGMFEISYKYFYLIIFALSTIIDLSVNTGGKISHIGGAVFGLIYGYYLKKGVDLFNISFNFRKKTKLRVVSHNKTVVNTRNEPAFREDETMDELLDKISKSGYDSLSKKEKDLLFKLSQKK